MRSAVILSCLATSAALVSPLAAEGSFRAGAGTALNTYLDQFVSLVTPRRIRHGMTRADVLKSMRGEPDETVGDEIWIYWDFASTGHELEAGRTALLIFFQNDTVRLTRSSDSRSVRGLLAQRQRAAARPLPAAGE